MAIDLNADLGESYGRWVLGDDTAMLGEISSANVACGYHAGDPTTLRRTCREAVARGVVIGAQVSYPDLAGFGRRFVDMSPDELADAVVYQIGALDALARVEGGRVRFVKPHGALYHAVIDHEGQAQALVEAVRAVDVSLPLLGFPGSALLRFAAASGLRTVTEYFIDRTYTADGRLVDRREPGAVITDPALATARALDAARSGRYDSMCTHGDTPGAVAMTRRVRAAVIDAGIGVRSFVEPPG